MPTRKRITVHRLCNTILRFLAAMTPSEYKSKYSTTAEVTMLLRSRGRQSGRWADWSNRKTSPLGGDQTVLACRLEFAAIGVHSVAAYNAVSLAGATHSSTDTASRAHTTNTARAQWLAEKRRTIARIQFGTAGVHRTTILVCTRRS